MIIPDINLLIYAYNSDAPRHKSSKKWWEELLSGGEIVGLPWAVSCGFLRLMTHPRVMVEPLVPGEAIEIMKDWFSVPNVRTVTPGSTHLDVLEVILGEVGSAGPLTTDAHIAAIAIEYNADVHSNDNDFDRFSGLRRVNPLV